jgi:hypothetical protein
MDLPAQKPIESKQPVVMSFILILKTVGAISATVPTVPTTIAPFLTVSIFFVAQSIIFIRPPVYR